jgi:hypothetical protein
MRPQEGHQRFASWRREMGCHLWASLSLRLSRYHQQLHLGGLCHDAASSPNAVRFELEVRFRVRVEIEVTTCNRAGVFFLRQHVYIHVTSCYGIHTSTHYRAAHPNYVWRPCANIGCIKSAQYTRRSIRFNVLCLVRYMRSHQTRGDY